MKYVFREASENDKEYLLNANKEINILSGLDDSTFEMNMDKDLFEEKICKSLIVEENGVILGFLLYSYVYWTNCGKGIYLSNAYVDKEHRNKGIFKMLLSKLEEIETSSNFITNLVGNENSIMMKSLNKLGYESSDLITYYKMKGEK